MSLLLRLLRFMSILSKNFRNPYNLAALFLGLTGALTALRGPETLVWGVVLVWMAALLRLLHTQRELLKQQGQLHLALLETLEQFKAPAKPPSTQPYLFQEIEPSSPTPHRQS